MNIAFKCWASKLINLNVLQKVYIDSNGDAEGNFTVISLQDEEDDSGAVYTKMKPVGYFSYTSHSSIPVQKINTLAYLNN